MSSFSAFARLSRPHFLFGGALMYALGVAAGDEIGVGTYLLGQMVVTSAQVTAHYVNEYADVEADRLVTNRTFFSGGSGVLVDGGLPRPVALRAAIVSSSMALLTSGLVALASPQAAFLGMVALVVSWAYSMPPLRLLNTGWGEVATSVVVAVLVPLIGVLVTGDSAPPELWLAIAVLFPIHIAMMLVFELPDVESDRIAGKTVLAVRLGEPKTLGLVVGCYVVAALVLFLGPPLGLSLATILPLGGIFFLLVGSVLRLIVLRAYGWATSLAVLILVLVGSLFLWLFLAR